MIIAAAQFTPVPRDIDGNAARMAALVTEAAGRGAGLVLFAELSLSRYDLEAIAADPTGMTVTPEDARLAPVREACRKSGIATVVNAPGRTAGGESLPCLEGHGGGSHPHISSFVYGPDGALLTRYDKRHLSGTENDVFAPGTGGHGRFTLGGIRFALATCFDNAFPEVPEQAAADGCRVYLSSAFHSDPAWPTRYAEMARDHGLHIVLANGTGTGTGLDSPGPVCGRSGAWLPTGEPVASAGDGTDLEPGGGSELVLTDVRDRIMLMADPAVAAIPVRECDEPLVDVRSAAPGLLVSQARHDERGAFAHLREGVPKRLLAAQELLPYGLRLQFVEGYRPLALQRRYFEEYAQELRAAHPGRSAARIHEDASRYVSPPDIAPHSAGGAVDLTLVTADGAPVDMGTPINASPDESDRACYTAAPDISPAARANRRVLSAALTTAGLVNYPTEWWHWSYGDRYWALATGAEHALYGPKELDPQGGRTGLIGMAGLTRHDRLMRT